MLYLHGFASCGEGNKSSTLAGYFGNETLLRPDLPYAPQEAIEMLSKLIPEERPSLLVGSSLGGFYATYFAEKFHIPAVLINPSCKPWETLADYVGWQERFCDGERFAFKQLYLHQLERFSVLPRRSRYLVLLQSEDEVLDYHVAKEQYKAQRVIVEYGGNHRFENIHEYLSMIESFMKS
ncbi:MAG: YqiA/YcfP family alpha/beta fold hydrolase [Sulfurimonas sp.]